MVLWAALQQGEPPAVATPPPLPDTIEPAVSKKQKWLELKAAADDTTRPRLPPPPRAALPVLSLYNVWTDEVLPVPLERDVRPAELDRFLRCHFTNQSTHMAPGLLPVVVRAARRFRASRIEVVSGYRAPKYNLWLRKKGHEVARDSQHPRGTAVDFRVAGVPTRVLLKYVRSLHLGGVGYYPESKFVHADVGPIRFWKGH